MSTPADRNPKSAKRRQLILLVVMGAIALYFVVDGAREGMSRPIDEAQAKTIELKKEIELLRKEMTKLCKQMGGK